jgi:hypothetical protein
MWNFVVISPRSVGKSRLDPGAKFIISSGPTRASTAVSSRKSQMIKLIVARHKITAERECVAKGGGQATANGVCNDKCSYTTILGLGQMSTTIWLAG